MLKSLDTFFPFLNAAQLMIDDLRTDSAKAKLSALVARQLRRHVANVTIFCGGWTGAREGLVVDMDEGTRGKYPRLGPFYSVRAAPHNAWYAGSLMHGADWKQSAGGFVHGFRYLIRAQARSSHYHAIASSRQRGFVASNHHTIMSSRVHGCRFLCTRAGALLARSRLRRHVAGART